MAKRLELEKSLDYLPHHFFLYETNSGKIKELFDLAYLKHIIRHRMVITKGRDDVLLTELIKIIEEDIEKGKGGRE